MRIHSPSSNIDMHPVVLQNEAGTNKNIWQISKIQLFCKIKTLSMSNLSLNKLYFYNPWLYVSF